LKAQEIVFYSLAALTIGSGLLAVTTRMIFRAAIFLLFSLIGIAGIYFWLEYEFIAAVQIIIYVGGIVVLIIFSIFLTQQAGTKLPPALEARKIFSGLACLAGFMLSWLLVKEHSFAASTVPPADTGVSSIGTMMLDVHKDGMALPFEVVSILLLAAMIGCIVIAMKTKT